MQNTQYIRFLVNTLQWARMMKFEVTFHKDHYKVRDLDAYKAETMLISNEYTEESQRNLEYISDVVNRRVDEIYDTAY